MDIKVYGASQYVQKVTEAPASVTIITADEIKKYGYQTLADVLQRWVSGLEGRLSYAIQTTNNEQTGRQLSNSPFR